MQTCTLTSDMQPAHHITSTSPCAVCQACVRGVCGHPAGNDFIASAAVRAASSLVAHVCPCSIIVALCRRAQATTLRNVVVCLWWLGLVGHRSRTPGLFDDACGLQRLLALWFAESVGTRGWHRACFGMPRPYASNVPWLVVGANPRHPLDELLRASMRHCAGSGVMV